MLLVMVDDARDGDEQAATAPEYAPEGVDLSLIRWSLSLTPPERLAFLERQIADILRIRALNART